MQFTLELDDVLPMPSRAPPPSPSTSSPKLTSPYPPQYHTPNDLNVRNTTHLTIGIDLEYNTDISEAATPVKMDNLVGNVSSMLGKMKIEDPKDANGATKDMAEEKKNPTSNATVPALGQYNKYRKEWSTEDVMQESGLQKIISECDRGHVGEAGQRSAEGHRLIRKARSLSSASTSLSDSSYVYIPEDVQDFDAISPLKIDPVAKGLETKPFNAKESATKPSGTEQSQTKHYEGTSCNPLSHANYPTSAPGSHNARGLPGYGMNMGSSASNEWNPSKNNGIGSHPYAHADVFKPDIERLGAEVVGSWAKPYPPGFEHGHEGPISRRCWSGSAYDGGEISDYNIYDGRVYAQIGNEPIHTFADDTSPPPESCHPNPPNSVATENGFEGMMAGINANRASVSQLPHARGSQNTPLPYAAGDLPTYTLDLGGRSLSHALEAKLGASTEEVDPGHASEFSVPTKIKGGEGCCGEGCCDSKEAAEAEGSGGDVQHYDSPSGHEMESESAFVMPVLQADGQLKGFEYTKLKDGTEHLQERVSKKDADYFRAMYSRAEEDAKKINKTIFNDGSWKCCGEHKDKNGDEVRLKCSNLYCMFEVDGKKHEHKICDDCINLSYLTDKTNTEAETTAATPSAAPVNEDKQKKKKVKSCCL